MSNRFGLVANEPVQTGDETKTFPFIDASRSIRTWLWTVAFLVLLMVVVGGATRLTESGLSITEWKPVTGIFPPLTEAEWTAEFDKYKAIPQYQQLFPLMSLSQFKFIFFWEWGHRLLGRLLGMAFAIPLAFFWISGRLRPNLKMQLTIVLALGALQGFVGWWMVKSGLSDRIEVSQYRLALHLVLASLTFAMLIWIAAGLRSERLKMTGLCEQRLRRPAAGLAILVLLQIGLGALVAGLRAGLTYNTWPLMDGHFIPPFDELARKSPIWSNLFENVTTVQFQHRLLAYLIVIFAVGHALHAWKLGPNMAATRRALLTASLIVAQAAAGVLTLLFAVPLWAGLLHQTLAMLVLGAVVVHVRLLSFGERLEWERKTV